MSKLNKWLSILKPAMFIQIFCIVIPKELILQFLMIFKILDEQTINLIGLIGIVPDMLFITIVTIMIIIQNVKENKHLHQ